VASRISSACCRDPVQSAAGDFGCCMPPRALRSDRFCEPLEAVERISWMASDVWSVVGSLRHSRGIPSQKSVVAREEGSGFPCCLYIATIHIDQSVIVRCTISLDAVLCIAHK
jgi:hypothetical protein